MVGTALVLDGQSTEKKMVQDAGDPELPDIAERLSALRREAYSRTGSKASFAALQELELSLRKTAQHPGPVSPPAVGITDSPAPATASPQSTATKSSTPHPRFSPARIGMIALAALAVAGIGFSLGRTAPAPTTTAIHTLPPTAQHGIATLALLDTPQRAVDVPPFSLSPDIIAETVHILPTALRSQVAVYGARSAARLVCLIAVTGGSTSPTLGGSAQTCVSVNQFVSEGILLRVTTNDLVADAAGYSNYAYFQYLWTGDGAISNVSNHYPFPPDPHF